MIPVAVWSSEQNRSGQAGVPTAISGLCSVGCQGGVVAGERDFQAAGGEILHVLGPQRAMLQVFGTLPRTVVDLELGEAGQFAGAERGGDATSQTPPSVLAGFDRDEGSVEPIDGGHEGRAGEGEVAYIGPVRALAVVDALDYFGNQAR